MNLRDFYTELVRHANGGLSGDTLIRVLVEGVETPVSTIYYNGKDLIVLLVREGGV